MTPASQLWTRIVFGAGLSLALLLALGPPRPSERLPAVAAVVLGAAAGILLFAAIARRRPRLPPGASSTPLLIARLAFFGLLATNEEVLWRRVALGELLESGAVPAVAGSTIGFALMHRRRPMLHLGTGGAFGMLYLSTGVLAASVAAHWTYNVLVSALVERECHAPEQPP
jgi:membrane protease YdiL (CAAX protease family)